ncbi:MAG TPA: hypothetical protein ENN60_01515 [archaeon]|nr:hypothetical protein [archaeon]
MTARRGLFTLEAVWVLFLLPMLFFLTSPEPAPIIPQETVEITHDLAQLYLYGHPPSSLPDLKGHFTVWINADQFFPCPYTFRYCTSRFIPLSSNPHQLQEARICAAACST